MRQATILWQVNSLEMEMLRMISFSLFVEPEAYERYRGSLYSHVRVGALPGDAALATGFVRVLDDQVQSNEFHASGGLDPMDM